MSTRGTVASRVTAENFSNVQSILAEYATPKGGVPKGDKLSAPQRTAIARALNQRLGVKDFTPDVVKELLDGWPKIAGRLERQAQRKSEVHETLGATFEAGRVSSTRSAHNRGGSVSLQVREAQRAGGLSMGGFRSSASRVVASALLAVALGTGFASMMPSVAHAQSAQTMGQVRESTGAASARSIEDLLARWNPDQHVWTIGDMAKKTKDGQTIRFSAERLADIEKQLDKTGKNWTVVVMETGTVSGSSVSTRAARDLAVQLANNPAFARLVDARTGEATGNILVITLNARTDQGSKTNVSYFASAAYDARGLGENNRAGLDQAFGRSWQGGYNLTDAILGAIGAVDAPLNRQIGDQQATLAAGIREAQGVVNDAGTQLDAVVAAASQFRNEHPQANGPLATPDTAALRAVLVGAQQQLAAGKLVEAKAEAIRVKTAVTTFQATYAEAGTAKTTFARIENDLKAARGDKLASAGEAHFTRAERKLGDARAALDAGNPSYTAETDAARKALQEGTSAVSSAHTAQNAQRMGVLFGILGLLGLLTVLNLRSRSRGKQAKQKLDALETALKEKVASLLKFNKESTIQLGSDPKAAREMYDGKTEDLAVGILGDLRDLLVFRSEMEKRVEGAKPLIEGKGARWWVNQLWPSNYNEAIAILSNQVFKYEPGDRVVVAIEGVKDGNAWLTEFSKSVGNMQRFELTFDKLQTEFDVRTQRMGESYKRITEAELSAQGRIDKVAKDTDAVEQAAKELAAKGAGDDLFTVPLVLGDVIRNLRGIVDEATAMRVKDPVGAVEGRITDADRQARYGETLVQAGTEARDDLVPLAERGKQALAKNDVRVQWIDERLRELSNQANGVARLIPDAAQQNAVDGGIVTLRAGVQGAAALISDVVSLNERRVGPSQSGIDTAKQTITGARQTIGTTLGLQPETALREANQDPSTNVAEAERQHTASKGNLDTGDAGQARGALDAADRELSQATSLVTRSLGILKSHQSTVDGRNGEGRRLDALAGERETLLGSLRGEYAAGRLQDLSSVVADARRTVQSVSAVVVQAQAAFKKGALLQSDDLLGQAAATHTSVQAGLDGITGRQSTLRQEDATNSATLTELQSRARASQGEAADTRTRGPARQAVAAAVEQVNQAAQGLSQKGRDPAAVAQRLGAASVALNGAREAVQRDWQRHAEATGAISHASSRVNDTVSGEGYSGDGSAGAGRLSQAQSSLSRGEYEDATRLANEAYSEADGAIRAAEAEIARRRAARQKAEAAISRAEDRVNDRVSGEGYSGDGSAGAGALSTARSRLANRDYSGAEDAAADAYRQADSAIGDAEDEISRRRSMRLAAEAEAARQAEEARQAEAARRAEEARQAEAERQAEQDRRDQQARDDAQSTNTTGGAGVTGTNFD